MNQISLRMNFKLNKKIIDLINLNKFSNLVGRPNLKRLTTRNLEISFQLK
jgi:hypothetical protein